MGIESHRQSFEIPGGASEHEHDSMLSMIECAVCAENPSLGKIVDMEERKRLHLKPLDWKHPARDHSTWIPGLDR